MTFDGLDVLVRLEQRHRATPGLVDGGIGLEVVRVTDEVSELLVGDAQLLAQQPQPLTRSLQAPGVETGGHADHSRRRIEPRPVRQEAPAPLAATAPTDGQ